MLKTTRSLDKQALSRNDGIRSAFSNNNNSRPASERNDSNGEFDKFGGDGVKYIKKSRKLKSWKLANSQKLSKSGKSKGEKSKNR